VADDTLRPAVEADLESLLVLNNAAVPAVNALDAAEMAWFAEVAHLFLVADSPKGPVGFLIGLEGPDLSYRSLNYQWFAGNYGLFLYVDRVVVDPEWWGRGLGRAFYRALVASAGDHPVLCAEVNLVPRNDRSLAFHQRFGFSPVGEQETEGGLKRVVLLEYPL